MQISKAIKEASTRLSSSDSARLDAELLLCSVLHCDKSYLYAHPEQAISDQDLMNFNHQVLLREKGHPIAHLLNKKEFWSLELHINEHTLIPRPETELLVETALNCIPANKQCHVLDLGTGSGAIAIAIASERPLVKITATDICKKTITVAKQNADKYNLDNINFVKSVWLNDHDNKQYDLIVSNPPYISIDDPHLKKGDVIFEPKLALVSGMDGLDDIKTIISNAYSFIKQNGYILLEHGYQQAEKVRALLNDNNFKNIKTLNDLNGHERVSIGQVA